MTDYPVSADTLFDDYNDVGDVNGAGRSYPLRYHAGDPPGQTELVPDGGTSLAGLIKGLSDEQGTAFDGLGVGDVKVATVRSPGSTRPSAIVMQNLGDDVGGDDYPGNNPPVFYPALGISYIRPLTADVNDVNGDEFYQTTGALSVTLSRTGEILRGLKITPTETEAAPGDEVGFNLSGVAAKHGVPSLAWSFGDGTFSRESQPTHSWEEKGTYVVGADVNTDDGSYGYVTVEITVGKPKKDNGNDDPGGGGNGDDDDPETGPQDGPGGQTGNDPDGDPDGLPGTNGTDGTGDGPGSPRGETDGTGQPSRGDDEDTPGGAADGEISGILLTSATTSVPSTQDEAPTLSSPPARPEVDQEHDPLLYAAIAVPLLLLAGALSEYRLAVAAAMSGTARRLRRRKEKTMGKTE